MLGKGQHKGFWKFTNKKLKTRSGVASLLPDPDNPSVICHNGMEKAEIQQMQFTSVFTNEPSGPIPQPAVYTANNTDTPTITEPSVLKKLTSLNASKSSGPDNLQPKLIKELACHIALPVTILYCKSIGLEELPQD